MTPASTFTRCLSLALLLTFAVAPFAAADDILLTNGRRLEGSATYLPDGRVEIKAAFGTLVLPASAIAQVENRTSVGEAVDATLSRLDPADAEGRFQVARWCEQRGAATLARRLYGEVLAIDPAHAGARQALGYRLEEGRWVTEEEYHRLRGEVPFRGTWMAAAERDRVLAWETAQAAAEVERRRAEARASEVVVAQARLAQASEAPFYGYDSWGYDYYGYALPIYAPGYPQPPRFKRPDRLPNPPTIEIPRPRLPRDRPVVHNRSGVARPPG